MARLSANGRWTAAERAITELDGHAPAIGSTAWSGHGAPERAGRRHAAQAVAGGSDRQRSPAVAVTDLQVGRHATAERLHHAACAEPGSGSGLSSADVRSRSPHHRRGTVGAVRRHCRQAASARLPGASSGACSSIPSSIFRRRWCSSRRRSCSRSAGCRSSRRYEKPTRVEALKYYRKVVEAFDLQIAFEEKVLSVERELQPGGEPAAEASAVFAVETRSARGVRRVRHARNVIFAIGYYDAPNLLNVPGEDLPHVHHYYSEPHPYYRQRVVIVGGGNSAAESALELFRAGAHVTLVHRHPELKKTIKYWVRPDIENRIKEGSIAARFNSCVTEIRPTSVIIRSADRSGGRGVAGRCGVPADRLSHRLGPDGARRHRAGRHATCRATIPRRSRPTCPGCSSPAAPSAAGTPATSSSRTAGSTARRSSRRSPAGCRLI